jgi:hypothetical protein
MQVNNPRGGQKKAAVISDRLLSGILTKIQGVMTNPHFATLSVQRNAIRNLLKLRYINKVLLNYADIFLAFFVKFVCVERVPVQNTEFWCDR